MAAKGSIFENDLLKLIFNGSAINNIADNALSGAITNLYVSLHIGILTSASTQVTNEATYGSYTRIAIPRNTSGWVVSANSVSPVTTIIFPTATSGSETISYFGVGTSATGSGKLLYWGAISPTISILTSTSPQLTTATNIIEL